MEVCLLACEREWLTLWEKQRTESLSPSERLADDILLRSAHATPSGRRVQPAASLEMLSWTPHSEMMPAAFTSRGDARLAVSLPWDTSRGGVGGKVTWSGMLLNK